MSLSLPIFLCLPLSPSLIQLDYTLEGNIINHTDLSRCSLLIQRHKCNISLCHLKKQALQYCQSPPRNPERAILVQAELSGQKKHIYYFSFPNASNGCSPLFQHTWRSLTHIEINFLPLSWALTVAVEETNSGVPMMAVLPVIRDLWPNLAWRGRTKGVCQQIAAGAEQKPPLLMRQKACGSPANPQELPDAAQTKPEIKKSQRQAHFYSRAKVFLFHGLGGFPIWDCNRAEKRFAIFSHRFWENRFLIFFSSHSLLLVLSSSFNIYTSHHTFWANFEGTKTSSCSL